MLLGTIQYSSERDASSTRIFRVPGANHPGLVDEVIMSIGMPLLQQQGTSQLPRSPPSPSNHHAGLEQQFYRLRRRFGC